MIEKSVRGLRIRRICTTIQQRIGIDYRRVVRLSCPVLPSILAAAKEHMDA